MRTRNMSYSDYGISDNEIQYIKEFCRNANNNEKDIIDTALSELNPYIIPHVRKHLIDGLSYEKLCAKDYIYLGKGDFYGKCRQGMAAIKRWMIIYGIWEIE